MAGVGAAQSEKDHHAAQIRMIDESLRFAGLLEDPLILKKRAAQEGSRGRRGWNLRRERGSQFGV